MLRRIEPMSPESSSRWPRPKRLFSTMRALKRSWSAELKPAPALKAPVCASFTSTTTCMRSSSPARRVVMLTLWKKPRRCSASRLLRSLLAEKSSCSWRRISRRITLSRVLVLPVTSMRSTTTGLPRSTL